MYLPRIEFKVCNNGHDSHTLSYMQRKRKDFCYGISELYVHVWKEGKQGDFTSLHLHLHLSLYSLIHSSVFFSLKGRFGSRGSRVK